MLEKCIWHQICAPFVCFSKYFMTYIQVSAALHVGQHVKHKLMLSDFKQNLNVLMNFCRTILYQIPWKSIEQFSRCCMWTDIAKRTSVFLQLSLPTCKKSEKGGKNKSKGSETVFNQSIIPISLTISSLAFVKVYGHENTN